MGVSFGSLTGTQKATIEFEVQGPVTADVADLLEETINSVLHVYKDKLLETGGTIKVKQTGVVSPI